jgi:RND superfamily putative drug exporter
VLALAAWTTSHRRLTVALWLGALAVGIGVWLGAGSRYANVFRLPDTPSQRARTLLAEGFPSRAPDANQIVLHARSGTLRTPALRRRVQTMLARVARLPHVDAVTSPYANRPPALSRDGTIGLATFVLARAPNATQSAAVSAVLKLGARYRSPTLQIEFGGPTIETGERSAVGSSMAIGLVAAIVVLLLSFGSVLAMGLPLATALAGLGTGVGLVALASRAIVMPTFSEELALMVGLGVGVDYALFVVTRFREAYAVAGDDVEASIAVALDTAGRAVLFAGLTVVVSLLGMCALGIGFLYGPAIASAIAVLLVLAASVTLLPALLATIGHRIGRGGRVARRFSRGGESRAWNWWLARIQRHPWIAVAAAAGVMLVLSAPMLGLRLGDTDAGNDPTSQTTRRAYDLLARGFGPGFNGPLLVVARLPRAGDARAAARIVAALRRTPDVAAVSPARIAADRVVAAITAVPASSPQSTRTERLVSRLRDRVLPPIERATGATAYVGGFTAVQIDFAHVVGSKLWLFVLAVTLLSAVFLFVVFRSFVVPFQAALMNLLSIGASLGVVVAIFQWGWLGSLTGVAPGPIQAFLPVMVFAIVFGLSMDYEIFLVSRIHEEWTHGSSSSEAVRLGLVRSGRVVTAAAAVMVAVFASFMLASDRTISLFGLGLATAVLVDAVVVRCLFLPALLELLGRATWWFPGRLDRILPRLAIEPPEEEVVALLRRRRSRPSAPAPAG